MSDSGRSPRDPSDVDVARRGGASRFRAHPLAPWIVAVALASFASGAVVGSGLSTLFASSVPSPDEDYVRETVRTFGLDAEQERRLRLVLQFEREEEIAILRSVDTSRLSAEQNTKLLALRSATERRIRESVLDASQRAAYDARSRPAGAVADPRTR